MSDEIWAVRKGTEGTGGDYTAHRVLARSGDGLIFYVSDSGYEHFAAPGFFLPFRGSRERAREIAEEINQSAARLRRRVAVLQEAHLFAVERLGVEASDPVEQLVAAVLQLRPTGEIGDGMVARLHDLAQEARLYGDTLRGTGAAAGA